VSRIGAKAEEKETGLFTSCDTVLEKDALQLAEAQRT
jgi:hypothetical protein